jgi:hypothetical protein
MIWALPAARAPLQLLDPMKDRDSGVFATIPNAGCGYYIFHFPSHIFHQKPHLPSYISHLPLKSYLSMIMKTTYLQPVILFLAGIFLIMVGLLFKIQHWPHAQVAIVAGFMSQLFAIVLLVVVLVRRR